MNQIRRFFKSYDGFCVCWIAVCFSLTSTVYLAWLYHLVTIVSATQADVFSMVIGYVFQAAGTAAGILLLKRQHEMDYRRLFWLILIFFFLVSLPALLSGTLALVLTFGFMMNLMCGVIAAFYLYVPARKVKDCRGIVFGAGYALSTILVGLISLLGGGKLLADRGSLIIGFLLAVAAALMSVQIFEGMRNPEEPDIEAASLTERLSDKRFSGTLYLTGAVVFLISLVKNLGFSFPSTDLEIGVSLELSRLFYAIGLFIAGMISDRNRKYGAICTMAALAIPFVMLSVADEPLPRFICWSLDYLFFGFFSVFRVVLFMDIAEKEKLFYLAPAGLMMGRVGDAVGTALCIGLGGYKLVLVGLTTVLFILATLLFFSLFHALYEPEVRQERSEREIFEAFSIQHDLSAREREVLRLLLAEHSNSEIAGALFVSESTVKYHVHNLLQKTGCKSRVDLVKKYNISLFPQIQGT